MNNPELELPDPINLPGKTRIYTPCDWFMYNRPIVMEYFKREIYGRAPNERFETKYEDRKKVKNLLDEQTTIKEVRIFFKRKHIEKYIDLLILLPKRLLDNPVPLFLGLNFCGNHSILRDPNITLSEKWFST